MNSYSKEQFVADFIMFYESMPSLTDVVINVELDKLYEKAKKIQSARLGESIERVIKFYKLKPAKKKHKKIS